MLKEIAIVTLTVTNLGQVEEAWEEHFDYQVRERGTVSTEVATHWGTPDMVGSNYVIMEPANAAPVQIRFVAEPAVATYNYMTSHGWNATELLVQSPDTLAAGMNDEHFEVIGAPRDLWSAPNAPRVMQAVGPGRELLYLTTNLEAAEALGITATMPAVDRAFIVIAGGPSMAEFEAFYGAKLGLRIDPPTPFRITTISKANKLDISTTYPLAIVHLAPGYLIELDELPAVIGAREVAPGRLPPGMAMVSFTVDKLPSSGFDWVTPPRVLAAFPYSGRRAGVLRGPAGELLELIESGAD